MYRKINLERLEDEKIFDIVVVGGGISGVGIARRAALNGFRTLLLEKRDFSWGTSSRSGKLVHGGLRYIKQGQLNVTYHSVREREKLLKAYERLIIPLRFAIPVENKNVPTRFLYGFGLFLYDLFAGRKTHKFLLFEDIRNKFPFLKEIDGVYEFYDAKTDDSGLTFQILMESVALGVVALNYSEVVKVDKTRSAAFKKVTFRNLETNKISEIEAKVVIFATGAWSDDFDNSLNLRKLKGSHLVFSKKRIPIETALALFHPVDKRPLYILPWEGVTLFGTTDIDFYGDINSEPSISSYEIDYLFEALRYWFADLCLEEGDVVSAFSGIRSVINTGKKDPSKENRDYVLKSDDNGIILVTGGKLTTFDYIANKVIKEASRFIKNRYLRREVILPNCFTIDIEQLIMGILKDDDVLRFKLKVMLDLGYVVHLDDLLLRRSRIGLTLKDGGVGLVENIKSTIKRKLNWDEARWEYEISSYKKLLNNHYRLNS